MLPTCFPPLPLPTPLMKAIWGGAQDKFTYPCFEKATFDSGQCVNLICDCRVINVLTTIVLQQLGEIPDAFNLCFITPCVFFIPCAHITIFLLKSAKVKEEVKMEILSINVWS